MNRTIVITGAGSGIGRATAERLRASGQTVIGVDVRNAEVEADLATPAGRARMIEDVTRRSPGGIDGVVAAAGLLAANPPSKTVAVNYFGAVATLEGLRPLLARSPRPRAVGICSTASFMNGAEDVVNACLEAGEEVALRQSELRPASAYIDSKRALAFWIRRTAIRPEWAGAGILLNGVAPGLIRTSMTNASLDDPETAKLMNMSNPQAVKGYGAPEEVAELVAFLLGFENHLLLGQIIFIDGGSDAICRTRHY